MTTMDDIVRKRTQVECEDYIPIRKHYRCQHYLDSGACGRDDYIMCVEWLKKNPDQKMPERKPAAKPERSLKVLPENATAPPAARPGERTGAVYDLTSLGTRDPGNEKRLLLERPELLTEQAVDQLSSTGIEVEVSLGDGKTLMLVPELTKTGRLEMTYQHARTVVMVLSVFPGATIESLRVPVEHEEAS